MVFPTQPAWSEANSIADIAFGVPTIAAQASLEKV
jgi:hypothetical protein